MGRDLAASGGEAAGKQSMDIDDDAFDALDERNRRLGILCSVVLACVLILVVLLLAS
jgi:hypothetical protein